MSFLIGDLFELNLIPDAILVAGKNGTNHEITWVITMEILDEMNNLNKGELLLTTGYKLDNQSLHEDLIPTLHAKGISGLIIQTGYYLSEIPKYIIEYGDKYDFPIIEIPKKASFSSITQNILRNIYNINFYSNLQKPKTLLENLSLGKNLESKQKQDIIEQLDLDTNTHLSIFLLSVTSLNDSFVSKDTILSVIHHMYNFFYSKSISAICENINNKLTFLISSNEKLSTQKLTTELSEVISNLNKTLPDLILLLGASTPFNNINNLLKAYEEAFTSYTTLKKMKIQKGVCFYNYICLLKSLNLINSDQPSAKALYKKIEPLINYDKAHQSNYFNTLKYFLDNGCNINETSEKLYIHRHTLRNRIEKIKELCGIDFNDNYSMLTFTLAIYLLNFF